VVPLRFVIVSDSGLLPLTPITDGVKDLAICGGAITVMPATAFSHQEKPPGCVRPEMGDKHDCILLVP
jgi:hypothetical protein